MHYRRYITLTTLNSLIRLRQVFNPDEEFTHSDYYNRTGDNIPGTTLRALVMNKCLERHLHVEPGRTSKSYYSYTFTQVALNTIEKYNLDAVIA